MLSEFAANFFGEKRKDSDATVDRRTSSSSSSSVQSNDDVGRLLAAIDDDYDRSHDLSTYLEPLLERRVEVFTIPLHLANRYDHDEEGKDDEMYSDYLEKTTIVEDILPVGSPERKRLEDYLSSFDVNEHTECIAKTLMRDPIIRSHMSAIVPTQVSYEDFWVRYFFRCSPASCLPSTGRRADESLTLARSPSCVIRETLQLLEECESVQLCDDLSERTPVRHALL